MLECEYSLCDSTSTNDDVENALKVAKELSPIKKRQRSMSDFVSGKRTPQAESDGVSTQSRSKRSIIWHFFNEPKKGDKFVVCKIHKCNKKVLWSGNTSNCRHHLEKRHPTQFYAAQDQVKVVSSTSSEDGDVGVSKVAVKSKQPSMRSFLKNQTDAYASKSKKKIEIDKKLTKMVIRDLQPLSIVDDVGFAEFVRELDPRYVLPSRRYLRDNLIEKAYQNTTAELRSFLNGVKYVGITFDGWTSCTTQHYLTITCHYAIKDDLKTSTLAVCPLNCRATASNLSSVVADVLQKYNIQAVAAVTDNASNVTNACDELNLTNIPCAAHSLQLAVNHAINNCKPKPNELDDDESINICALIQKCKDIVSYFHRSSVGSKCLEEELIKRNMPVIRLQQSVETRWNSVYYMLESINKTADAVLFVLLTVENKVQQITPRERKIIPMILTVLKPFLDATVQLSSEKSPTMSLIIPCTKHILEELDAISANILQIPEIKHLQRQLKNYVAQYLMPYEARVIPGLCTLLDPRFKQHGFQSNNNYLRIAAKLKGLLKGSIEAQRDVNISFETPTTKKPTGMFKFLSEIPATPEKRRGTSQAIVHFDNYLEEAILPFNSNIIQYWQNYKGCEELKNIALKHLVVPATAVPSERVNSTAGNIITDKRSRLTPNIAEKLILLRKNFEDLKL